MAVRAALPTGTVTFVFTDVEGSTRLVQELGAAAYARALLEHRLVVRAAFGDHGGVEVDAQGDAFFFAFPTVAGALAAAARAQTELAQGAVQIRVGVHTGSPLLTEEGYVGEDVHRAARIAAAAHGGQVLVSEATAALAERSGLRDLGEHRFKDLRSAERVFQLGTRSFPPIKSLYRTNLPVPATGFLGRERELAEVATGLREAATRLLTLTGPGGTGKTRLALQAAAEVSGNFPGGVYWVPLAPVRDPALVVATVAAALEVPEEPGVPALQSLAARLADSPALLVLDNAEHLMPAVADDVAALLAAAPALEIVVTSRERLRVAGEQTYPVPTLAAAEAAQLFLTRARAVDASTAHTSAVDELCARLEYLPLALELAAARVGLLSPEQLLTRLGRRLDLLKGTRDLDPRQQTLRAAVAWSYDLLEPAERAAFCRFSVFAGGCTLESAEAVCDADLDVLQSLLDKSLLRRRDTASGPRLWMLETLREFAADQLASDGGTAEAAQRHLDHYATFVQQVAEAADTGADYDLDRIENELDNLRVALDTAVAADPQLALALAGQLGDYWSARGHLLEGRQRLASALEAAPDAKPAIRIHALRALGLLELSQADLTAVRATLDAALTLAREADERRQLGSILNALGIEAWYRGSFDEAIDRFEAAADAHRHAGNERGQLTATANLAGVATAQGDHRRAIEILTVAAAQLRGRDDVGLAKVLNNLGLSQEADGRQSEARASFERSIELSREHALSDTLRYALASLAHLLLDADPDSAASGYRESLEIMHQTRDLRGIAYCLEGLAAAAVRLGQPDPAAVLLGAAATIRHTTGASLTPAEQHEIDETEARATSRLGQSDFAFRSREGSTLGGFNWSSQHLVMEVVRDGCSRASAGDSCDAWPDVVAGSTLNCAAGGSAAVLA